ncbi:MAG: dTDP-4-dehydrorhamnose reductase [Oceanospirillaceae bacterium]|nr:dTDP-4-dehydrorhamnose reductase [Oceanospirillaceae bacterium]
MKILVLGATGQVGFEVCRSIACLGEVYAPGRKELDLSDLPAVEAYLQKTSPNIVINAAAYTQVDKAESEPDLARKLNADLPELLANHSATQGSSLVHYSSDYVYDGNHQSFRKESMGGSPVNRYGETKLQGDLAISRSGCEHLIFRTCWVYSARGKNFMKTMLDLGKQRTELNVVDDQIGSPTPARLIANVTTLAIHSSLESGIYHLAPKGQTSWHGFAREIFYVASRESEPLMLTADDINPIPTHQYPTPAKRPLNSRLDTSKLEQALNIQLPEWKTELASTLNELLEK